MWWVKNILSCSMMDLKPKSKHQCSRQAWACNVWIAFHLQQEVLQTINGVSDCLYVAEGTSKFLMLKLLFYADKTRFETIKAIS